MCSNYHSVIQCLQSTRKVSRNVSKSLIDRYWISRCLTLIYFFLSSEIFNCSLTTFWKLFCNSQIRYADSRSKKTTQLSLQSKETNVVNFMRLLVMRLVFGVASAMGLGENLSGVLGGIFVPPGAEEYNEEYGDDDLIVPDIFWRHLFGRSFSLIARLRRCSMAMIAFRKLCRNKEHLNNKAFKNNCFNKKLLQIIKNCIYIYIYFFFIIIYIFFIIYIYIFFIITLYLN